MKNRKRQFREKLNFSKAEILQSSAQLMGAGIMLPREGFGSDEFEGRRELDSFGWAGNDPKFYADVRNSDIIPKPEDFIEQPFRLLSATIVGGGSWKATDFSDEKVLKKSTALLNGKGVYKDHETDTDNWVGIVNGTKWSPSTTSNGIKVPAGIDGVLAIDSKTNPKVARGILIGNLYSNSVTVVFDWEMSHEFESQWDFYDKIGTIGSDGKMIRRVVTAIYDYHETSLVWLGADPFSKAYDENGDLKHIDVSSIYEFSKAGITKDLLMENESEERRETLKKELENSNSYKIGCAFDKSFISLSRKGSNVPPKKEQNNNNNTQEMKDVKALIAVFMAVHGTALNLSKDEDLTPEQFKAHLESLTYVSEEDKNKNTANEALAKAYRDMALEAFKKDNPEATEVDIEEFSAKYTFVNTEAHIKNVEAMESFNKSVKDKRAEVERLYKLSAGDKASDTMINLFKKAEGEELDGLIAQYGGTVAGKFSGSCTDCGSTNLSFQSSKGGETITSEDLTVEGVSMDDLRAEFGAPTMDLLGKKED